jgi:competence protein ComEC
VRCACYWVRGWNITIIATALYAVAGGLKLSPRRAFWAILACIWLYTLFVGATPTVIRAAVGEQQLERRAHAWSTRRSCKGSGSSHQHSCLV